MKDLMLLENELVPVYLTDAGEKVVYGRELHEVLKPKSKFADWVKNRLQDCDSIENEDFQTISKNLENGGRTIEYIIKLDTAKEMAMLERNDIGKSVRKYFIGIEKKYKEDRASNKIPFTEQIQSLEVVSKILRLNDAGKILMIEKYYKSSGLPTDFLPDYEFNGNHDMKALTTLLKKYDCPISAKKFNILLVNTGYLEERERESGKGEKKKYKSLTEKGLKYGENAINPKNLKETQPLYYEDLFMELYESVIA